MPVTTRNNKRRWTSLLQTLCLCAALFHAATAQAGLSELINKMNTDTLTWRIRVVDKQGRAIPAPTVWRIIPNGRDQWNIDLMRRLVRRYAGDVDLIKGHDMHPSLMIDYGNRDGLLVDADIVNYHKASNVTTLYAVIKRGYLPTVISDVARKNTTHELTIVLEIDPKPPVDIRMLEFDLIRANAYIPAASGAEIMQEDRRQVLLEAHRQMRKFAQRMEDEHLDEWASAVYYNLAHLPSVDVMKRPDGSETIIGYTNGFTANHPQRVADRERAIELNPSYPPFMEKRFLQKIGSKNIFGHTSPQRKAYIEFAENMIAQYGERMSPHAYFVLFRQYQGERLFAEACVALKRAYQFEPTSDSAAGWAGILRWLKQDSGRAGYQGPVCELEGLVAK